MTLDDYLVAMVSRAKLMEQRLIDQQIETDKSYIEAIEAARIYVTQLRLVPTPSWETHNATDRQRN